jgi:hypothetical protein
MPAKDRFHEAVRHALEKDGWTITHDPLRLDFGQSDVYIDLGAERLIGAERGSERIAVEIKTFIERSQVRALESAVGQYVVYSALLAEEDPGRHLFLAVTEEASRTTLDTAMARAVLKRVEPAILTFDPDEEVIVEWKT